MVKTYYPTFGPVKKGEEYKPIPALDFLRRHDLRHIACEMKLPLDEEDNYPSHAKLGVISLRLLKGKSVEGIIKHLEQLPEVVAELGFKHGLPPYHVLTYFRNKVLTVNGEQEWDNILKQVIHDSRFFISDNEDYVFGKNTSNPLKLLNRDQKVKLLKSVKAILERLHAENLTNPKVKFPKSLLLHAINFMAMTGISAYAFHDANRWLYDKGQRGKIPSYRTILTWIREILPTREKVAEFQQHVVSQIFEYIKINIPELKFKKFVVAIDCTSIPTWEDLYMPRDGRQETQRKLTDVRDVILNSKDKAKGTTAFRKYITLSIVVKGLRFCLGYAYVDDKRNKNLHLQVDNLIDYAKKYIGIRAVLMDRNFDNSFVKKVLIKRGLYYICPKVISREGTELYNLKKNAEMSEEKINIVRYKQRDVYTNLIFIRSKNRNYGKRGHKNKKKKYVIHTFCTNMPIKSKKVARALVRLYRSRWGIETFYKDRKQYNIKTSANDSVYRDFCIAHSINMFNLWVLANLIMFVCYLKQEPNKPKLRKFTFAQALEGIMYVEDPPPEKIQA